MLDDMEAGRSAGQVREFLDEVYLNGQIVHSGELPAVRVGRSFRVTENDVDEYLRKSFFNAG